MISKEKMINNGKYEDCYGILDRKRFFPLKQHLYVLIISLLILDCRLAYI